MIKLDLDHPVFTRLGDVIYVFSIILLFICLLFAIIMLFDNQHERFMFLSTLGLFFYGMGWSVRFILSGKKYYLFQKYIEIQLYKLRRYFERKNT